MREQEFYATSRKLQTERATAPHIVAEALRNTPRSAWATLVGRADLLTCGAIDHLGTVVTNAMTRDPKYALALAELAVALAGALPDTSYHRVIVAQIRAAAWKSIGGKALSYLARHDEAIEAFGRAEQYLDAFATLAHERATVRLNLAITYLETERYAESLAVLAECRKVFEDHGDDNHIVPIAFYEGAILQRLHKYREARETYLLLIASSSDISPRMLAALHQAIGLCSTELGDYEPAETNLRKAITLHRKIGQPVDAVRGEHGRGMLLIRRGRLPEGIAQLRAVRHEYLKASLAEEAGLCGLEIVGAFLQLGKAENAEALARTIMNEFLAASLNDRAVTALGYLSEAIAARKAPVSLAADVRQYVLSLRREPEREFPAVTG